MGVASLPESKSRDLAVFSASLCKIQASKRLR